MLINLLNGTTNPTSLLVSLLMTAFAVVVFLPLHELAHGYVAYKLGDPTAKYTGRLTMNPSKHLDLFGTLSLLICGFGWAKPVMVNSRNFKNPRRDIALTALAGPVSNLLSAFVLLLLLRIVFLLPIPVTLFDSIYTFLITLAYINVTLAIFNLIPIPPLDGSKILFAFTPYKVEAFLTRNQLAISIVFIVLLVSPILDTPRMWINNAVVDGMWAVINWPFSLMGI